VWLAGDQRKLHRTHEQATSRFRWENTRQTIKTWVGFLPIREVAVVAFGHRVSCYPDKEAPTSFVVVRDEKFLVRQEGLAEIMDVLQCLEPGGPTPTYDALKTCLSTYEGVNAVFMFTDGLPEGGFFLWHTGRQELSRIAHDLIPQFKAKGINLNIILLGDYGRYFRLLPQIRALANETNGALIGR
jgi:hypothetical protein